MLTSLCDKCGAHENYQRVGELEEVFGTLRQSYQSFAFAMSSIEKRNLVLCRKCLGQFMTKLEQFIGKTNQGLVDIANEELGLETKIISLDEVRDRRTTSIKQVEATAVDTRPEQLEPVILPNPEDVKIGGSTPDKPKGKKSN